MVCAMATSIPCGLAPEIVILGPREKRPLAVIGLLVGPGFTSEGVPIGPGFTSEGVPIGPDCFNKVPVGPGAFSIGTLPDPDSIPPPLLVNGGCGGAICITKFTS